MNRRITIIVALFALALWAIVYQMKEGFRRGPKIGSPAPSFQLQDLQGQPVSLEALRGKAILLNFWATWCGPCLQEMPSLESLYQKYRERGLIVVGVSLDEEGWPPIEDFLKKVPVTFPIVNDKDQAVSELYQTYRVPETYLIDPRGNLAGKFVGPQDFHQEVFHQKIERVLPSS